VAEEIMLDPLYDLPDQPSGAHFRVTEEVVRGEKPLLAIRSRRRLESA
jgi:ATP-dependent protease Clp ATPase subunit